MSTKKCSLSRQRGHLLAGRGQAPQQERRLRDHYDGARVDEYLDYQKNESDVVRGPARRD